MYLRPAWAAEQVHGQPGSLSILSHNEGKRNEQKPEDVAECEALAQQAQGPMFHTPAQH